MPPPKPVQRLTTRVCKCPDFEMKRTHLRGSMNECRVKFGCTIQADEQVKKFD
jgi:hypothetical protein